MKKTNVLKITLIISIVILLTLIAFAGIYVKKANQYVNKVPEFKLGMDLSSKRVITLKPETGTRTTIYDENGNTVSSIPEDADESKYTKETTEINPESVLNEKNYEKEKAVIEKRLDNLKAEGYTLRLDKNSGDIIVEIPDNDNASKYASALTATGRFELVDEDTKEVVLSESSLKKAKVIYSNDEERNTTAVFIACELDKAGKKKLEEMRNTYVSTTTKVEETGEEKTVEKKVDLKMDWQSSNGSYALTDRGEYSLKAFTANGICYLPIGESDKKDKVQDYYDVAFVITSALNSGKTEVEYKIDGTEVLKTDITKNQMIMAVGIMLAVFIVVLIVMVIKYKALGVLGAFANIGMVSLTIIFIKIAKITVTISFIPAMIAITLVNTLVIIKLINKIKTAENKKNAFWKGILETVDYFVVLLTVAIVFIFMAQEAVVSCGMIMFWGIISMFVVNLLVTRTLLIEGSNK